MNETDELLIARMMDLEKNTLKYKTPSFTRFLDLRQTAALQKRFVPSAFVRPMLWGGFEQSERQMLGLFPEFMEPEPVSFPISVLRLDGTGGAGHRQILGSVLSLGIKREMLGDILPFAEFAYLVCETNIADFLCLNLERIGREHVRVNICDPETIELPERQFKLLSGTVASLRLDCVVAMGTGESRAKACEYIRGGLVNLNWEPAENPSLTVSEGDVLSIRHFGRMEISESAGETRKGRIRLTLKQYI